MSGTSPIRILRSVHPLGAALTVCGATLACFVGSVLWFFNYMKGEPSMASMEKDSQAFQQGMVKPNRFGLVPLAKNTMYVTRAADKALTVLWPYGFAHDDNYFQGYLFSDTVLRTDKVTALAPTRYTTAHKAWMTHLKVDRKIGEHWYHVYGEMYK